MFLKQIKKTVVDTPAVRSHSLYRPALFTSAFVSTPSALIVRSSKKEKENKINQLGLTSVNTKIAIIFV